MAQLNPHYKPPKMPRMWGVSPQAPLAAAAQPREDAPGSSTFAVSGIDSRAPIRNMRAAQEEQAAATQEMGQAANLPISGLRGVLGGLAGAGVGALFGGPAGAEFGSSIVEAPRRRAMGLAASRAAAAEKRFGQEKDIAATGETVRGHDIEERRITEQSASAAADRTQRGLQLFAPTEAGGRVIQAPQYAAEPGTEGVGKVDLGAAAPEKPEYKTDAAGNLISLVADATGKVQSTVVVGPDGQPMKMPPEDADDFTTFIANFRKANPNATPAQENGAILEFKKSGAATTSIDLDAIRAGRETTESTAVAELVAAVQSSPSVRSAIQSNDPNAYNAAVEAVLAQIPARSPSYAQYVNEARTQLLKTRPSRPPAGATDPLAEIRARRQQQQPNPGAPSTAAPR